MVHFCNANKWISVCWGGIWSKSSICKQIVPRNHISKSFEGKQFINVRSRPDIVPGVVTWSRFMQLRVPLAFICHFLVESFHTLKIELDFFSRQGHWTLYWTGVYQSLLHLRINNDGRLSIFCRKGYFVIFCCNFVLK